MLESKLDLKFQIHGLDLWLRQQEWNREVLILFEEQVSKEDATNINNGSYIFLPHGPAMLGMFTLTYTGDTSHLSFIE